MLMPFILYIGAEKLRQVTENINNFYHECFSFSHLSPWHFVSWSEDAHRSILLAFISSPILV